MPSTIRRPTNPQSNATGACRYYIITLSNFPILLQRTQQYQQPFQYGRQQQGGMLVPGVAIHFGTADTDLHERLLYNTLRFELQEAIRGYLHRTRRLYPINFVFDMSAVEPPI